MDPVLNIFRRAALLLMLAGLYAGPVGVSAAAFGPLPMSLKGVPPPVVAGLLDGAEPIVVNQQKAIALGKALFWDVAVGSDGMACASCHFHAGADTRTRHQVAPAGHSAAVAAASFESATDGTARRVNGVLKRGDFPFTEGTVPLREIAVYGLARSSDDVVGSAGAFGGEFHAVELSGTGNDTCLRTPDAVFHGQGNNLGARAVTRRNAPTVINAVFNHRNFWDGRANNVFNGSSPWGERDAQAGVWIKNNDGSVSRQRLHLVNASLAAQAVSPPLDASEMSCVGRTMADLGRKLQWRRPLQQQTVDRLDSVFGAYSLSTVGAARPGLNTYYVTLVRQAFNAKYWSSPLRGPFGTPTSNAAGETAVAYNQFEANFGMFFALAIQLYEATLVSDDAPFDRSRRDAAGMPIDLSASAQRGMDAFRIAHCNICHVGPVFTAAAVTTNAALAKSHAAAFGDAGFKVSATQNLVDRGRALKGNGFVDTGFAATGVGKAEWDAGLGANDRFGNSLSFAAQYLQFLSGRVDKVLDPGVADVRACDLTLPIARNQASANAFMFTQVDGVLAQAQDSIECFNPGGAFVPTTAAAARQLADPATRKMLSIVDGAFKIPSLRNVELTGPYMHNGGMATLDEVVEFYARGGNFDIGSKQFGLVFPQPDLQLSAQTRLDLINFLKSLTDERVRYQRAPFDHPALPLRHGHESTGALLTGGNELGATLARDAVEVIPAVGATGSASPLEAFDVGLGP